MFPVSNVGIFFLPTKNSDGTTLFKSSTAEICGDAEGRCHGDMTPKGGCFSKLQGRGREGDSGKEGNTKLTKAERSLATSELSRHLGNNAVTFCYDDAFTSAQQEV